MKSDKNCLIEIIRFIMACCIMMFHIRDISPIGDWFIHANTAVTFFFVLSGYLMANKAILMSNVDSANLAKETYIYIKRRLESLYVPYIIIFVISLLYMILRRKCLIDIGGWMKELLLLQSIDTNSSSLIPQAWYVSTLIILSLIIYPVILKMGNNYTRLFAPIIAVFTFGYLSNHDGYLGGVLTITSFSTKGIMWGISGLNFGIFLYGIKDIFKGKDILCRFINAIAILISLLYLALPQLCFDDFSIALFMGLIVICSFNNDLKVTHKLLLRVGNLSMYIFLAHMFIRKSIVSELVGAGITNQLVIYFMYFFCTIVLSIIVLFIYKMFKAKFFHSN